MSRISRPTVERDFNEARLPNVANATRNGTLMEMASIKSMIKRSLAPRQKRLRMDAWNDGENAWRLM